jgi:hypothetical protein
VRCIDYAEFGKEVAVKISKCSKRDIASTQIEAKWLAKLQ